MIADIAGNEILGYIPEYVMFDLETTGLDTENDSIVEIGAVRVRHHEVVSEFRTLVNPYCEIPQRVIDLHGIDNDSVAGCPGIKQALEMFDAFIGDDILVGQNIINFDLPLIYRDSRECFDGKVFGNDYCDMLKLSREALPGLQSHSMKFLGEMFGCSKENPHRALQDCHRQYEVFEWLGKIKGSPEG